MIARYATILAHDVTRADHARRRRRSAAWRMCAAVDRTQAGIRLAFRHSLLRAQRTGAGLFLHSRWAVACLGDLLNIDIAADRIRHVLPDWLTVDGRRMHTSDYFLFGGCWRTVLRNIETTPIHCEAQQLHAHGLDYRSTTVYAEMTTAAQRGRPFIRQHRRLADRTAIDDYFERFVALYVSIRDRGLLRADASSGLDVGIALGPHGEPVRLPGGQHRLAIAQVLEMPSIPVQVRMLHADLIARASRGAPRSNAEMVESFARAIAYSGVVGE